MISAAFQNMQASAKRFMAALHDVGMACLALVATLGARYGFDFVFADPRVPIWVATFAATCAVVFFSYGLGRGIWRFASLTDLKTICIASLTAILIFLILTFLFSRLDGLPRSLPALTWINMVFFIGAPRLIYRALKDGWIHALRPLPESEAGVEDILLVGSSVEADQAIRAFGLERSRRYRVRGIVETRPGKTGRDVRGIPIIGDIDDFDAIVMRLRGTGVSLASAVMVTPKTDKAALQNVANRAAHLGLAVRRVPAAKLATAEPQLESVTLEDLLGRPSVSLDLAGISALINGRCVMVTGAGGSIGSEIVRQVSALAPSKLVLFDNSEFNLYAIDGELERTHPDVPRRPVLGDVRSATLIRRVMLHERPAIVFHAAAFKHVPMVELNPCEGVLTNVCGTQNVADAAIEAGAGIFVMISTDKAIRPSNIMGATKRVAEMYCQALDASNAATRFITVRFGNVLGSTGSVVPYFKEQISRGGPVTVTHPDMRRYFMVVNEATELVLQAAVAGMARPEERGRIFVLDMGEPVKIIDLARTMIALAGLRPDEDIPIIFTGLRPGEKMFEEIFDDREQTIPSGKDGVFMAKSPVTDASAVRALIVRLERAAADGDINGARNLLCSAVPELPAAVAPIPNGKVVPFQRG